MTEEQKQRLLEIQNKICENIKPFIELMNRIWMQVKDLMIKIYNNLKEFLTKKISIKTKTYKKGKKYVHNYKKIELWKWVKLNE